MSVFHHAELESFPFLIWQCGTTESNLQLSFNNLSKTCNLNIDVLPFPLILSFSSTLFFDSDFYLYFSILS